MYSTGSIVANNTRNIEASLGWVAVVLWNVVSVERKPLVILVTSVICCSLTLETSFAFLARHSNAPNDFSCTRADSWCLLLLCFQPRYQTSGPELRVCYMNETFLPKPDDPIVPVQVETQPSQHVVVSVLLPIHRLYSLFMFVLSMTYYTESWWRLCEVGWRWNDWEGGLRKRLETETRRAATTSNHCLGSGRN